MQLKKILLYVKYKHFVLVTYQFENFAFCKIDLQLKVKHKTNLLFFLNWFYPIHPIS